jgi:hypothetical protein
MPEALNSRFTHLTLEPDLNDFTSHAIDCNFHPAVIAFVRFRPELLHQYDRAITRTGQAAEKAYPCPRTWEYVSNILSKRQARDIEHALIMGTVGRAAAGEFLGFLQLWRELPDIDQIIADPEGSRLPEKPATCYAVASALARMAENGNLGSIITYLDRLPEQEYAVLAVKEMIARNPKLNRAGALTKWKVAHANVLL